MVDEAATNESGGTASATQACSASASARLGLPVVTLSLQCTLQVITSRDEPVLVLQVSVPLPV